MGYNIMTKTYLQEKKIKELKKKINEKVKPLKGGEFDDIIKVLLDSNFVFDTKKLLDLSFNMEESLGNIKSLLSGFMIENKPDEIFNQVGDMEKMLISMNSDMIKEFNFFLEDKSNEFKSSYEKYLKIFKTWKSNDLTTLLFVLSSAYQDLIITKDKLKSSTYENKEEKDRANIWMKEIDNQKKLIESSVRKIGGDDILESFLTGKFFMDLVSNDFKDNILVNLQKAYFDKLKEELKNLGNEKPFTLIKTLKEIRDLLFKMVPSRTDLHSKWLKKLNIELLEQKLNKEGYYEIILEIFNSIFDIIKLCESKERNKITDNLKEEVKKIKKKGVSNTEIDSFIIENIGKIYEKINNVFVDVGELKNKLEKKN